MMIVLFLCVPEIMWYYDQFYKVDLLSQIEFFLNVILDHKLNSSFFFSRFIATFLFS